MIEPLDILERRIDQLRSQVRDAVTSGDRARSRALRAELRTAEQTWDRAVRHTAPGAAAGDPDPTRVAARRRDTLLPVREQVHDVLTLLTVPAAVRLIGEVYGALFPGEINSARLTSLRRDEERSFRAAPRARPYYLCSALTTDLLTPARGLLAISTWPLERRVVGPLSPRVDFLTAAVQVARHVARSADAGPAARHLLGRFAANIPGTGARAGSARPEQVIQAANAELAVHQAADHADRVAAAGRVRAQFDEAGQLFGTRPWPVTQPAGQPV